MEIMTETRDGFRIAEEDLRLRGPGEFFGTRQSGLPEFMIADISNDMEILIETRDAAFALIEKDPELARPEHGNLKLAIAQEHTGYELASVS